MVLNPVKIKSTDASGMWGVRASSERKVREDLSEEVKPKGMGSAQNRQSVCQAQRTVDTNVPRKTHSWQVGGVEGQSGLGVGETGPEVKTCGAL